MNGDVVTDLKQFITATFSQQLSELRSEFVARFQTLETKFDSLGEKVDDLSAFVSETIDIQSDSYKVQFINHEKRLTKLESKAA